MPQKSVAMNRLPWARFAKACEQLGKPPHDVVAKMGWRSPGGRCKSWQEQGAVEPAVHAVEAMVREAAAAEEARTLKRRVRELEKQLAERPEPDAPTPAPQEPKALVLIYGDPGNVDVIKRVADGLHVHFASLDGVALDVISGG